MQPIQINVSVSIGVNQELHGLLSAILNRPQVETPATIPAQRKQKVDKPQPTLEVPERKAEVVKQEVATTAETTAVAEQPNAKDYTEVDVREAMDRTRKRIEGENYKEQTDSDLYKKWHRRLTAFFKNTAANFGSDKPSTLPDSESRAKFIACCDAVYVKDDELVKDCPF